MPNLRAGIGMALMTAESHRHAWKKVPRHPAPPWQGGLAAWYSCRCGAVTDKYMTTIWLP